MEFSFLIFLRNEVSIPITLLQDFTKTDKCLPVNITILTSDLSLPNKWKYR